MVGTNDLRQLLSATTTAGTKTVLVGDEHQLAPVKARGGMFAQLCADLPWAQHLSEVSRMRDPEERSASLALRDGGPASMRRAIGWYRTHDRLYCGDAITMAADALAAHRIDTAAGKDALLVCDTTEMAAVFNNEYVRDQSPTATPSPCTPPKASPPTPPTPCSARRPLARCSTSQYHEAAMPTPPTSTSVQLNVSMTASTSTACKALSAEPAGTPVASLERSSPMTAAGQLPPTVLQPRPRVWACPTASQRCSAAEPPQSFVGERSTQSGRQNRELSSMPWFRPALGTPAGHENTVSTTGSTF